MTTGECSRPPFSRPQSERSTHPSLTQGLRQGPVCPGSPGDKYPAQTHRVSPVNWSNGTLRHRPEQGHLCGDPVLGVGHCCGVFITVMEYFPTARN